MESISSHTDKTLFKSNVGPAGTDVFSIAENNGNRLIDLAEEVEP
jgi:hypothetical protein